MRRQRRRSRHPRRPVPSIPQTPRPARLGRRRATPTNHAAGQDDGARRRNRRSPRDGAAERATPIRHRFRVRRRLRGCERGGAVNGGLVGGKCICDRGWEGGCEV